MEEEGDEDWENKKKEQEQEKLGKGITKWEDR